jgi:AcrR family transcriptional regulator
LSDPNPGPSDQNQEHSPADTKTRLLDAAEELFAKHGFSKVSVRDLAAAAQVNAAAVNYHFQGKENLYREVITRRFVTQRNLTLEALEAALSAPSGERSLELVVEALVGGIMKGTIGHERGPTFLGLIARDMLEDTNLAHGHFFKELVVPVFRAFSNALKTTHPAIDDEALSWVIGSIIAQIQHFALRWEKKNALPENCGIRQTMIQVFPVLGNSSTEYIKQVTDHITRFSCAAIRALYPEVE